MTSINPDDRGPNSKAIRLLLALKNHWQLSDQELATLLDHPNLDTVSEWTVSSNEGTSISPSELERIGILLDIHANLRVLFQNPNNIYGWIRRDNAQFSAKSPLSVMMTNLSGLKKVRQFLHHETQQ